MYCTPILCGVRFARYVAFWVVLVDDCTYFCLFCLLAIVLPVFLRLMASAYPFDIFKLYFSFRQYSTIWRLLLKSLCGLSDIFQTPSQRYGCIEIWYEFQNVWMYDLFLLFWWCPYCSSFWISLDLFCNVFCVSWVPPSPLFSLFLDCSSMLYVSLEFIPV